MIHLDPMVSFLLDSKVDRLRKVHRNVSLEEQKEPIERTTSAREINSCHELGGNNKPRNWRLADERRAAVLEVINWEGQVTTADLKKRLARSVGPRDDDLLINLALMRLLCAGGCWPKVARLRRSLWLQADLYHKTK